MVERFAGSARLVVFFAGYEAAAGREPDVAPFHLLLALACLYPQVLVRVLRSPEALQTLRRQVLHQLSLRPSSREGDVHEFRLGYESRRVLQNAGRTARDLWRNSSGYTGRLPASALWPRWQVGTLQILHAIIVEPHNAVARLLLQNGADTETVWELITGGTPPASPSVTDTLVCAVGYPVDTVGGSSVPNLEGLLGPRANMYTRKLRLAILGARYEATRLGSDMIEIGHLLPGLVAGSVIGFRGTRTTEALLGPISQVRPPVDVNLPLALQPNGLSPEAQEILRGAENECEDLGHSNVGTGHLLLGLLKAARFPVAGHLKRVGLDLDRVRSGLSDADIL